MLKTTNNTGENLENDFLFWNRTKNLKAIAHCKLRETKIEVFRTFKRNIEKTISQNKNLRESYL